MRYILKAYYRAVAGERVLARFVVHDPIVKADGIWCTHNTAWGGMVRTFHKRCNVVDFYREE